MVVRRHVHRLGPLSLLVRYSVKVVHVLLVLLRSLKMLQMVVLQLLVLVVLVVPVVLVMVMGVVIPVEMNRYPVVFGLVRVVYVTVVCVRVPRVGVRRLPIAVRSSDSLVCEGLRVIVVVVGQVCLILSVGIVDIVVEVSISCFVVVAVMILVIQLLVLVLVELLVRVLVRLFVKLRLRFVLFDCTRSGSRCTAARRRYSFLLRLLS